MPFDDLGNEWEGGSDFKYEFQTQIPPSKRTWPPPREHLLAAQKTWLTKFLRGRKYQISIKNLEFDSGELVVRNLPAFLKPAKLILPSPLLSTDVRFNINGQVLERSFYFIPMPVLVQYYQKLIHQYRKVLRKDKIKGYRNNHFFIRFGKWSGASKFGLGVGGSYEEPDEWASYGKRYEAGVSVYGVHRHREGKGWVLNSLNQKEALHNVGRDYWSDMLGRALKNRPIFLLRGDLVTLEDSEKRLHMIYGSDGEPLLVPGSIKVIRKLTPWEVFLSESGSPIKTQFGWKASSSKVAFRYLYNFGR